MTLSTDASGYVVTISDVCGLPLKTDHQVTPKNPPTGTTYIADITLQTLPRRADKEKHIIICCLEIYDYVCLLNTRLIM